MLPLTLWGHWGAPNPYKVCIVLEALKLPYKTHLLEFSEVKQESYIKINPNGRLPALQDPNTGVTLFEVSCPSVVYFIGVLNRSSRAPLYSTLSICMTKRKISLMTRSSRSTKRSNGSLSRFRVR
jgi:hypothetical protein